MFYMNAEKFTKKITKCTNFVANLEEEKELTTESLFLKKADQIKRIYLVGSISFLKILEVTNL